MTETYSSERPTPQNVARIEAEKRDGAKTFRAGQKVNVRPSIGAEPVPAIVVAVEPSKNYGNIVIVRFADGREERKVASLVSKGKA